MFCKKCGEKIDNNSNFCSKCGTQLRKNKKVFSALLAHKEKICIFLTQTTKGKILKKIFKFLFFVVIIIFLFHISLPIAKYANKKWGFKSQFYSDYYFRKGNKLKYSNRVTEPNKILDYYRDALYLIPDDNKYGKINIYAQTADLWQFYLLDDYQATASLTNAIELQKELFKNDKNNKQYNTIRLAELYEKRVGATSCTDYKKPCIEDLTEAIKLFPNRYDLYFKRMKSRDEKDYGGQIEDLTGMLKTTTEEGDDFKKSYIYYCIGLFQAKLGKSDLALKSYESALKLEPDDPNIYVAMARIPRMFEEEKEVYYWTKARDLYKKSGNKKMEDYCEFWLSRTQYRLGVINQMKKNEAQYRKNDIENERTTERLKSLGII